MRSQSSEPVDPGEFLEDPLDLAEELATVVEKAYGRPALIDCMLDPRRLLATYNSAVKERRSGDRLPSWSPRLLCAVRARPATTVSRK